VEQNKKAAEAAFSLTVARERATANESTSAGKNSSGDKRSRHSSASLISETVNESGRDNWIRTNDPHHVKVVL
jgi:hypothetical protein